ncbi:MAG TPA: LamG domain-containing protein [Candidatus Limnocylindria bacterium]|nr:LamG domain-containing protein [Candidatus Limnocylindria bacterium]
MKKLIHFRCILAVLGCLTALLANAQNTLTNGLVSQLDFENSVNDGAIPVESTLLLGGRYTNSDFGNLGRTIHFDGVSTQGVVLADAPWLKPSFLTVSAWMRTSSGGLMQIAAKGHYPESTVEQWSFYVNSDSPATTKVAFAIKRNSGGIQSQGWYFTSSPSIPLANQWVFLAASWDGTRMVLYVDGKQVDANSNVPPGPIDTFSGAGTPAGDIQIGRSTVPFYYFQGDIDQFKLHNRALSAAEIQSLYLQGGGTLKYEVALASARIVNGFFVQGDILKGGYGYTNVPKVRIVGGGGSGATAQANVTNFMVTSITVLTTGSGYTNTPSIWIDAPIPIGASATAIVNGGGIASVNVDYPGFGYTGEPVITLIGGGGYGAEVEPIIIDGLIQGFRIVKTGQGYTSAPFVRIDPPTSVQIPTASLDVGVKSIQVTLHVVQSHRYVLEGTSDFLNWIQLGDAFDAVTSSSVKVFDVGDAPGFFRLRDITYNP